MRLSPFFAAAVLFAKALPDVFAKDDEDDDGFFYFQDNNDWSDSAIYPQSCIDTNQGETVVFQMYKKGHNQCKRRSLGTYQMDVNSFVKAYVRQQQREYEMTGQDYEVDDEAMEYLKCQQYYYNNNMYYLKIGCRSTGKGFMVHPYTDAYCTQKASYTLNMGIDISSLRVSFETCKSCVASSYGGYNKYNNNGNYQNNNNGAYNNYQNYGYGDLSQHESMLCSAADHYKETCNRSCRRAAKKTSSSSSRSFGGGGWDGDGFSPLGKFFLWVLSLSAVFFLLAGLAQRKKMSKQDALIEEAAIKSSGVDKKYIPRMFVGLILFIIILILFKKKTLTWFFLIAINIGLLAYWMHLKNKAEQNAAVSGFQLYGEGGAPA